MDNEPAAATCACPANYAEGGRRSLQAMIEAVRYGGLEMLGAPTTSQEGRKDPIYFDGSS